MTPGLKISGGFNACNGGFPLWFLVTNVLFFFIIPFWLVRQAFFVLGDVFLCKGYLLGVSGTAPPPNKLQFVHCLFPLGCMLLTISPSFPTFKVDLDDLVPYGGRLTASKLGFPLWSNEPLLFFSLTLPPYQKRFKKCPNFFFFNSISFLYEPSPLFLASSPCLPLLSYRFLLPPA